METEFDFELFERILKKLSSGGQLTPEEQKAYDGLFTSAGEGLDLTGQPDFNKLVGSYYGDLSGNINREFEGAYGENVVKGPDGKITFSRPGSVMENFMRRGLSVNDGPAMASMSEGLTNRDLALEKAREQALSNAYRDMTPIRQQNLDALFRAGQLAQGAANRGTAAIGGARRMSGGGGGEGEGPKEPLKLPLPDQPDLWERILPGLVGALGTGGLALLRDRLNRGERRPGGRTPLQKFSPNDDVPLPPTRPQPNFDPYDKIEAQRATPVGGPGDALTTKGTSLGDENYQAEQMLGPGMSPGSFGQVNAAAPAFQPATEGFTPPAQLPGLGGSEMFNPYSAGQNQTWDQYLQQPDNYVQYPAQQTFQEYPQYQAPQYNAYEDYYNTPGQDFYDEWAGGDDSWYGDSGGGDYYYDGDYSDWGYM